MEMERSLLSLLPSYRPHLTCHQRFKRLNHPTPNNLLRIAVCLLLERGRGGSTLKRLNLHDFFSIIPIAEILVTAEKLAF